MRGSFSIFSAKKLTEIPGLERDSSTILRVQKQSAKAEKNSLNKEIQLGSQRVKEQKLKDNDSI